MFSCWRLFRAVLVRLGSKGRQGWSESYIGMLVAAGGSSEPAKSRRRAVGRDLCGDAAQHPVFLMIAAGFHGFNGVGSPSKPSEAEALALPLEGSRYVIAVLVEVGTTLAGPRGFLRRYNFALNAAGRRSGGSVGKIEASCVGNETGGPVLRPAGVVVDWLGAAIASKIAHFCRCAVNTTSGPSSPSSAAWRASM